MVVWWDGWCRHLDDGKEVGVLHGLQGRQPLLVVVPGAARAQMATKHGSYVAAKCDKHIKRGQKRVKKGAITFKKGEIGSYEGRL